MRYFRVKEWAQYQHYKDRNPPWIKLHRSLLTSPTWVMLDDASKALAVACMLLAAATGNKVPFDPAYIQRAAYLKARPKLEPLFETDFIEFIEETNRTQANASGMLASCTQMLDQSARAEETETETETKKTLSGKPDLVPVAQDVLSYLNKSAGKGFELRNPAGGLTANAETILARLREGYTREQLREVVFAKCEQWSGDEKMAEYLRPETLFGRKKFQQYLGELKGAGGGMSEMRQ